MMTDSYQDLLNEITLSTFADESSCISELMPEIAAYESRWSSIAKRARGFIETLRDEGMGVSVEAFLQEYGLTNKEGVAIMCLAEALLRIPDSHTADKLIDNTFDGAEWEKHIGHSESLLVNASSWGLLLTGKIIEFSESEEKQGVQKWISRLTQRSSDPMIRNAFRTAMKLVASQFVLGEDINSSLKKSQKFEKQGYRFSYDMLGEGARTKAQAERYYGAYMEAIQKVGASYSELENETDAPSISIKLSALHPRYEWAKKEMLFKELLPQLKALITEAHKVGVRITIDAEEAKRLDISLEIFKALFLDPDLKDFDGLGIVLQAYQKRAFRVIDFIVKLSDEVGKQIPIRLVKGAYWDTEIKLAQTLGLSDYPVFTVKPHSDISYLACAKKLLDYPEQCFPQFATHNALTISAIIEIAGDKEFEFQRLYGMGEMLFQQIRDRYPCRIYAPIGEHQDLLAYLIRRLLENGANTSFVHNVLNKNYVVEDFLERPSEALRNSGGLAAITPPKWVYKDARENSPGFDLGCRAHAMEIERTLNEGVEIDSLKNSSVEDVKAAIDRAEKAFDSWDDVTAVDRAAILEEAAAILELRFDEALKLCVFEAHKTTQDCIDEWREAIDFLRYYAIQTRKHFDEVYEMDSPTGESNILELHGRGVFACISPWNFPLAIFIGQVSAALAAGNCVLAKPAEQTPAVAKFAVDILHEAGIPKDVLQLIPGDGPTVGGVLTKDDRVKGFAFTGSTATAKIINRQLAEREGAIVPLIAETGGLNAMIIDSSALLEHAIDDVVHSAFGSAGQRCSALRVCYIENHIADEFMSMLEGAMAARKVGDPQQLATDIGPLIDHDAQKVVDEHIKRMHKEARFIAKTPIDENANMVLAFVEPHAFEIQSISELEQEIFGPVLHVIRYDGSKMDDVIQEINDTGYGLTFGIHSRIRTTYERACDLINAGNCYVNRSMTGAVVGVQPFGGEGLSGTGPKAGGPHYVLRFSTERTITNNTAAIGGNVDLLIQ